MQEPLVSIIVPIYKVEAYLDNCVQSVVDQTYRNLEIILVDDGSPDSCGSMCEAWGRKDSRIRVIHKENGGLSDARNAGLAIAKGELIAFVDSDDSLATDFIAALYTRMVKTGADIAECSTRLVDENGNQLCCRGVSTNQTLDKMEALRRLIMEDGVYQTVWNKLYRREVIDGIMFEKGKYNEDDFWTYQVFDRATLLTAIARPLYNYLQRGTSIMGASYSLKRLDGLQARYQRAVYLRKYGELAVSAQQKFVFDCMWHLQCSYRNLRGNEKKAAETQILKKLKRMREIGLQESPISKKQRLWYMLFIYMPKITAHIRNILKIGL